LIQDGDRGPSGGAAVGSAATAVPWFLQMAGHPIQLIIGFTRLLQVTADADRLGKN